MYVDRATSVSRPENAFRGVLLELSAGKEQI